MVDSSTRGLDSIKTLQDIHLRDCAHDTANICSNHDHDIEQQQQRDTNDHIDVVSACQIFLGGSCNPTTWRHDIVIPILKEMGISYYNPQVDEWTPEMVKLESSAKEKADILFFVIDKQTRSTVGMVEASFIASTSRKLILVMFPFGETGSAIAMSPSNDSVIGSHYARVSPSLSISSTAETPVETLNVTKSKTCTSIATSTSITSFMTSSSSSSSLDLRGPSSQFSNQPIQQLRCQQQLNLTRRSFTIDNTIDNRDLRAMNYESQQQHQQSHQQGSYANRCRTLLSNSSSSCLSSYSRSSSITTSSSIKINGEYISHQELIELHRAKATLQDLMIERKIPIFCDIKQALGCAIDILRNDKSYQRSFLSNFSISEAPPLLKRLDEIPEGEMALAKSCESASAKLDSEATDTLLSEHTDDQLARRCCAIPRESITSQEDEPIDVSDLAPLETRDVYLNMCDADNSWREQTALPLLRKFGLTCHYVAEESTTDCLLESPSSVIESIGEELEAIRSCRILLFVISDKCRGLSSMVLAAHYMAMEDREHKVVLCIQYLQEPCIINGEQLTKTAVADYNRGRIYLSDHAVKANVPMFDTIEAAIECCAKLSQDSALENKC